MINRRNFLKRCSILPFVGSLAVVAKPKAFRSPSSLMYDRMRRKVVNPPIYTVCEPCPHFLCCIEQGRAEDKLVCTWKGKLKCGGQNGILCPRCKYCIEAAEKAANPMFYLRTEKEVKELREEACKKLADGIYPLMVNPSYY